MNEGREAGTPVESADSQEGEHRHFDNRVDGPHLTATSHDIAEVDGSHLTGTSHDTAELDGPQLTGTSNDTAGPSILVAESSPLQNAPRPTTMPESTSDSEENRDNEEEEWEEENGEEEQTYLVMPGFNTNPHGLEDNVDNVDRMSFTPMARGMPPFVDIGMPDDIPDLFWDNDVDDFVVVSERTREVADSLPYIGGSSMGGNASTPVDVPGRHEDRDESTPTFSANAVPRVHPVRQNLVNSMKNLADALSLEIDDLANDPAAGNPDETPCYHNKVQDEEDAVSSEDKFYSPEGINRSAEDESSEFPESQILETNVDTFEAIKMDETMSNNVMADKPKHGSADSENNSSNDALEIDLCDKSDVDNGNMVLQMNDESDISDTSESSLSESDAIISDDSASGGLDPAHSVTAVDALKKALEEIIPSQTNSSHNLEPGRVTKTPHPSLLSEAAEEGASSENTIDDAKDDDMENIAEAEFDFELVSPSCNETVIVANERTDADADELLDRVINERADSCLQPNIYGFKLMGADQANIRDASEDDEKKGIDISLHNHCAAQDSNISELDVLNQVQNVSKHEVDLKTEDISNGHQACNNVKENVKTETRSEEQASSPVEECKCIIESDCGNNCAMAQNSLEEKGFVEADADVVCDQYTCTYTDKTSFKNAQDLKNETHLTSTHPNEEGTMEKGNKNDETCSAVEQSNNGEKVLKSDDQHDEKSKKTKRDPNGNNTQDYMTTNERRRPVFKAQAEIIHPNSQAEKADSSPLLNERTHLKSPSIDLGHKVIGQLETDKKAVGNISNAQVSDDPNVKSPSVEDNGSAVTSSNLEAARIILQATDLWMTEGDNDKSVKKTKPSSTRELANAIIHATVGDSVRAYSPRLNSPRRVAPPKSPVKGRRPAAKSHEYPTNAPKKAKESAPFGRPNANIKSNASRVARPGSAKFKRSLGLLRNAPLPYQPANHATEPKTSCSGKDGILPTMKSRHAVIESKLSSVLEIPENLINHDVNLNQQRNHSISETNSLEENSISRCPARRCTPVTSNSTVTRETGSAKACEIARVSNLNENRNTTAKKFDSRRGLSQDTSSGNEGSSTTVTSLVSNFSLSFRETACTDQPVKLPSCRPNNDSQRGQPVTRNFGAQLQRSKMEPFKVYIPKKHLKPAGASAEEYHRYKMDLRMYENLSKIRPSVDCHLDPRLVKKRKCSKDRDRYMRRSSRDNALLTMEDVKFMEVLKYNTGNFNRDEQMKGSKPMMVSQHCQGKGRVLDKIVGTTPGLNKPYLDKDMQSENLPSWKKTKTRV